MKRTRSKIVKKKQTSVLIGRAKNEAIHLLEWISYHKVIGFDEIVISSNKSDDGTQLVLDVLARFGIIRHLRYDLQPGETADRQMAAHLLEYCQALPIEWGAFFDIDEFLVLHQHRSVNDFLGDYPQADAIAINWRTFGSNGQIERDGRLTIERFTACSEEHWDANKNVKSIARLREANTMIPHQFSIKNRDRYLHSSNKPFTKYNDPSAIDHSQASINHYVLRSRSEFLNKRRRGNAFYEESKQGSVEAYDERFFRYSDVNDVQDDAILCHLADTKIMLAQIKKIAGIESLIEQIEVLHRDRISV